MSSLNTSDAKRDLQAYQLAETYLLKLAPYGVTKELLAYYLAPPPSNLLPSDLADVYLHLIESAQNRGMMATVVGKSVGGIGSLRPVLCGFQPTAILARFHSPEELLDTIQAELQPRGKVRRGTGSLWLVFTRAALSGARFLAQFNDGDDFCHWVQTFDEDPRKRAALPLLLSREIAGFGFALSCDFLKELGFFNFAKPDVHVTAIMKGLGLCSPKANDYTVFKTVVRIASNCGLTPYNVDKLFWLVGSGKFYDHPHLGKGGRIPTDRQLFIRQSRAAVAGTI